MKKTQGVVLAMSLVVWCSSADAGILFQNTAYLSQADSPFNLAGGGYFFEDFEDGTFDLAGLIVSTGLVKEPGPRRDSVDGDDGNIDGFGIDGWAFKVENTMMVVDFAFDTGILGGLPSDFGVVFTDGPAGADYLIEAWDAGGALIDSMQMALGDAFRTGETGEDRFLGATHSSGISRFRITSNMGGFELDHFQFNVIPAPATGLILLAGAGCFGRRRRR